MVWMAFSQNNGVKLVFEVPNANTHLRRVYYPNNSKKPSIPLLKDFSNIVKSHEANVKGPVLINVLAGTPFSLMLLQLFNENKNFRVVVVSL
jgi:hypothetical protein